MEEVVYSRHYYKFCKLTWIVRNKESMVCLPNFNKNRCYKMYQPWSDVAIKILARNCVPPDNMTSTDIVMEIEDREQHVLALQEMVPTWRSQFNNREITYNQFLNRCRDIRNKMWIIRQFYLCLRDRNDCISKKVFDRMKH